MKDRRTICLCVIEKNESKIIERLIDSCSSIIDYWVIVDTGSTDNTIEVIKAKMSLLNIPGELHEREWKNYGHNRTELVQIARGKADYLLLADADFAIVAGDDFNKGELTHNAYHIKYQGDIDYAQMLLVSGSLDWKYIGATHEYIHAPNIGDAPKLRSLEIIHHADGAQRPEKIERDIALLEKAVLEDPENTRNYFYLGQTYSNKGDFEKAIYYYTERARRGGWSEEVFYSLYQIGFLQYRLKNTVSAIAQLHEAYSYRPTRFEPLSVIGVIFREQKKYHLAAMYQKAVLDTPYPEKDMLFIHKMNKQVLADFELAICYYWTERYEEAFYHASKVKNSPEVPVEIAEQNEKNFEFINSKLKKRKDGKNEYIFCSMFTVETPYEEEVKILQKSLDDHGVMYEIIGIKNRGSWVKNTQMKPSVIKAVMEKYDRDVVWVDADAVLMKDPVFFETVEADVSFYTIKEWNEMLVGTIYFKNCKRVKGFLDKWLELNNSNDKPDGENFQILMGKYDDQLKVVPLPAEYIKIFDNELIKSTDHVIVHNQASRRFKNEIKEVKNEKSTIIRDQLKALINGETSCSVIGNGPFKTNLSKEINKSFVVRCNNFKFGYKEIGEKIDLNISSLHPDIIPKDKVSYPVFGILPISDTMYQQYTDAKMMHYHWLKSGQGLIDKGIITWMYGDGDIFADVFKDVTREIGAFPTVGIMGIAMARWLGFKKIVVSGFTFFTTEKSHYFHNEKIIPSSHHSIEKEKDLLIKWMANDNIEYVLDELTLNSITPQYAGT